MNNIQLCNNITLQPYYIEKNNNIIDIVTTLIVNK